MDGHDYTPPQLTTDTQVITIIAGAYNHWVTDVSPESASIDTQESSQQLKIGDKVKFARMTGL